MKGGKAGRWLAYGRSRAESKKGLDSKEMVEPPEVAGGLHEGKDIEGFQPVFVWLDVSTENNCRAKNGLCEGQKGVAQTESTVGLGALKVDTN